MTERWAIEGKSAKPVCGGAKVEGGPLAGCTVLELSSGIAGALTALRLQDLGAEVTRAELAGCRRATRANAQLDRGKKSVLLTDHGDLEAELDHLIAGADIVILANKRSHWTRHRCIDLHRAESEKGHTARIWIDITDFGPNGPLAGREGSELVIQAMAGYLEWLGRPDTAAVRLGADVAGCSTAIFAVGAVLAARFAARRGGSGQLVELSRLNSLVSLATIHVAAQTDPDGFEGPRVMGPFYPPQQGWRTKGRPIAFSFGGAVGAEGRPGHEAFIQAIGANWLLEDSRVAGDPSGLATTGIGPLAEECKPLYEKAFSDLDDEVVIDAVRRVGGVATPYYSYEDLLEHEQIAALGTIVTNPESGESGTAFPAHFGKEMTRMRWGIKEYETERVVAD